MKNLYKSKERKHELKEIVRETVKYEGRITSKHGVLLEERATFARGSILKFKRES